MDMRKVFPWWTKIRHAYQTGDLEELAHLVLSDAEMPPEARRMLGNLMLGRKLVYKSKGKKGAKRMFEATTGMRRERQARLVKRMQSGELREFSELGPQDLRDMGFKVNIVVDPQKDGETTLQYEHRRKKAEDALEAEARKLRKARDASGRMRQEDAIERVAKMTGEKRKKTLTEYVTGKSGAGRRAKRRRG